MWPVSTIELVDRFQALLHLETTYRFNNYLLSTNPKHKRNGQFYKDKRYWRTKTCGWMYHVVDTHHLDRELVCIAMHYMDMYLSKKKHICDNAHAFQLVGMTSLYMAIKIFRTQGKCATVSSFVKLSKDVFTENDFLKMEKSILDTLRWHMHPPTPQAYLDLLIIFLPRNACLPYTRRALLERIKFLLELSVTVQFFYRKKPSSVAVAAFIEVMQHEQEPNVSKQSYREHFLHCVRSIAGINVYSDEVVGCLDAFKVVHKNALRQMNERECPASPASSGRKLRAVTP